MFGSREKVRTYAHEHGILKLVDKLVNELLRQKPPDPLEHLESYIHFLRGEKGTVAASAELKNRFDGESHAVNVYVPYAEIGAKGNVLENELALMWEASRDNFDTFKQLIEKKVQKQSVLKALKHVAHILSKSTPKPASSVDTSLVQLKFDASQDVTQAKTDQGVQLVKPYSAEYKPSQSVTEVVDGLADWFAPGRKLWPKSAINRVKNNCTFMQHKHNYGEAAEVVIPLFIYSISVMTDYTWAFWVTSDGNGRWTPFSGKEAVVLEKDFSTLRGAGHEDLTCPREMPLSSLKDTIKTARHELSVAVDDNSLNSSANFAPAKESAPDPVKFEVPTKMQVIFSDGCIVGGNKATRSDRKRPEQFVGWQGLTVFVSTPFLNEFSKTTGKDFDTNTEFYIARYELTDVKDDYEKALKKTPDDKPELARLSKRIVLNPYTDTVSWLPVPTCIFEGLAVSEACHRPTTPQTTMSFERLPPPGALEYLQSRRTCEHLRVGRNDIQYLNAKDAFECDAREKKVLGSQARFDTGSARPSPSHTRQATQTFTDEHVYVRCSDPTCFKCDVNALRDRCIHEKNQQRYHQGCKDDLDKLLAHPLVSAFKKLIDCKIESAERDSHEELSPTPLAIIHSLDIQEVCWYPNGDKDAQWHKVAEAGNATVEKEEVKPIYASLSGNHKFITDKGTDKEPCPLFKSNCEFPEQPYYILNASMRDAQNHVHKTQISVTNKDSTTAKGDKDDAEIFCPRSIASLGKGMGALCEVTRKHPDLCRYLTDLMRLSHQTSFDSETTDMSLWYTSQDIISKKDDTLPPSDDEYLDPVHYDKLGYYRYTKMYDAQDPVFVEPDSIKFQMGDWVSDQVRPLLFYVNEAMKEMSPVLSYRGWRCAPSVGQKQKCYRGLANARLPPELYATGNVVVWSAFSSTSTDQGISQYYAGSQSGKNASVFIVKGSSCRLIAPWSRFGREEEWLYPLNSMFQVKSMLSEDQQSILGKKDFQLFEISEVDEQSMEKIRIRCSLASAQTKEVARVVFSAVSAVDSGNGVLDLSLKTAKDGVVEAKWVHTVMVNFDALHLSPVMTSNNTKACEETVECAWKEFLVKINGTFSSKNPCVIFDQCSEEGRLVLKATSLILGLRHSKTLTFVEVTCHFKESSSKMKGALNEEDTKKKQDNEQVSGYYQLKAMNPTEQWEVTIEMRCEEGHDGFAMGNDGAHLLHEIIAKQVHLVRIDIRNNNIDVKSAELLLQALRLNKHIVQLIIYNESDTEQVKPCLRMRSSTIGDGLEIDFEPQKEESPLTENDIQQVINIRCAHNKGTIVANTLSDVGSAWPKYASMALYDLDALDMDFADLFDTLQQKTVMFITLLRAKARKEAELRKKETKYPKLPGALVAAARCCDVHLMNLLLTMKCDPFETDDFGETPYLKMSRREKNKEHLIDDPLYAQLSQQLYVCLDRLQPAVFRYDEPLWKVKNFALEVMRMADDREHISLATELIWNVRVSYEAFLGSKPPDVTAGEYDANIKDMVEDIMTTCKECVILKRLQCPVGRLDSSLLCLKVVCTRGNELFPLVQSRKNADSTNGLSEQTRRYKDKVNPQSNTPFERSTGRRKYKNGLGPASCFCSYAQFCVGKEVLKDWANLAEEPKKPRKMDKNGVYYFEHEVKRTEAWAAMKVADMYSTNRRMHDGVFVTKPQFLKKMWNEAELEPEQIRRQNSDGFFVFQHDWDETTEGSKWEDGTKEKRPCEPPLVQQLKNPALNLYDPKVFGSRIEMEQSREKLRKWAKLWGGVNAVLVTSVEKERELFRKVENVTDTVMYHHLRLKRGELYCQPDITLWNVERRYMNPDSCCSKAVKATDCCRKARTREEFTSDFHDSTGKLWREAQRRWTGKDGQEASYEGELRYENEFVDLQKSDPLKVSWEKAKREDPHSTYQPGVNRGKETDSNSSITTILFSARGKMQGEWVGALSAEHDVLLPALEMFVVEDIQVRGASLHISLISRGSLLRTDKELRTWCSRIQDTVLHPPKEGRQGKVCTDTVLQAPKKTEVSKDDLTGSFSTEEGHFFFSRKSQLLPPTERQAMVDELKKIVKPVNSFGFFQIRKSDSTEKTNHRSTWLCDELKEGCALPTTYRPGKTFLKGLNRIYPPACVESSDPETEGIETATVPYVELPKDWEKEVNTTIRISSRTIQAYHDTHKAEDVYFETMDKKERKTPGEYAPPVKEVYGDKEFRITVGEVQQLLKTTTMVTSPSLPQRFVQCLIGSFTSAKHRLLFFNVFSATSLLSLKGDWEHCKGTVVSNAEEALKSYQKQRQDTLRKIRPCLPSDVQEANTYMSELYRVKVQIKMNTLILAYLKHPCRLECGAEPADVTRSHFVAWMDHVQAESTQYGFTSKEHARLTLTKSMSELSTEMCVSQQGFFFTSGIDGGHNQICERTQQPVTFLAAPGMDFCYKQPTLREAPKYFVRIPRKGQESHEGWSYFQEGKQHEFLHRLKVLYTCIFEAAKKQRVRNMSMLPMGLGLFTRNLGAELKHQVAEMYFRAQFELLAEKDWGFDNVCI